MCGIAGYYSLRVAAQSSIVSSMCRRITHRGPDDEGIHVDGGCGIGMRRLSIIDVAGGRQPIANEDGSLRVVFNGEIYNYRALRQELEQQGHRFQTRSDTETIVHLYEQYGAQGFAKLRGMFAIALWDAPRRKLLLARDRFGKKPLYYAATAGALYFASELKCLRGAEGLAFDLDEQALQLYLRFGYIPDPATPFRSVRKLPPGGWLSFGDDGTTEQGLYWQLPYPAAQATAGLTMDEAAARIRELFDESVRIRLESEVPLGAFLSGGIDSGSVVASMAIQSGRPVKTFSIGFEEKAYNELDGARLVAEQYKTDHHEFVVKPDSVELVEKLVRHFDEPFGDSSAIPTWIVSELARRHVTVVLTGDGGDEFFLGYESLFRTLAMDRYDAIPTPARQLLGLFASALPYRTYGKNLLYAISRTKPFERYLETCYPGQAFRRRLHQDPWFTPTHLESLRQAMPWALPADLPGTLRQAIFFEATAKLTGDMLVKVDRMSMANSIEVRSPLMDHVLAEYALSIPASWHMHGGRGKALLLRAIGDRLPPGLLTLPKRGFGVPLAEWFRGPLRPMLLDHLTGSRFRQRGYTNNGFVQYLIEEHHSGRRDNAHRLWELLMLELWHRDWESGATS
jgi:asparagine synthase (glutamine-hydrolysing)